LGKIERAGRRIMKKFWGWDNADDGNFGESFEAGVMG
jgi:hypothetical protein